MRYLICTTWLAGMALCLIGCGATRPAQVVIDPSYSYVQADRAAGVITDTPDAAQADSPTVLTSVSAKLPPMPAAPGFDTVVLVPTDSPLR